jgi:hypothetical protein
MSNANAIAQPLPADRAPIFDGFPYLVTRIVASLHHIMLLPRDWDIEHLVEFGHKQALANKLPTCLVLALDLCAYFREDGSAFRSNDVPHGVTIASGKLAPAEPIPDAEDIAIRRMKLILREEAQFDDSEGTTIITVDLSKGGRLPTPDEEERLAGTHCDGVPKGLWPCPDCGEWRGECFHTLCRQLVVRVHCTCENDNRCAGCGELLHSRKLNSNNFDQVDGKIWHTPAFSGLEHRCAQADVERAIFNVDCSHLEERQSHS